MSFLDLLVRTRDGETLSDTDIQRMIQQFTAGEIPDYQMAAWLMAVYFRGLSLDTTAALTLAMAHSGKVLDLSSVPGIKVDKHSTGGVADTVTLILAPLVAAAGIPVAKMSGRGLGFTGGTIDKLEAIPGFQTALSEQQFMDCLKVHHLVLSGQSDGIAPADGKLYALRDVTGTVASIPLIASSVMSKKIASGADRILLDVKVGQGAFMKNLSSARELAETMVEIGQRLGKKTVAILTDMSQPLGAAVGNGLEVAEAIEVLQGGGPVRLREAVLTLGSYMLLLAEQSDQLTTARIRLEKLLDQGQALAKFKEWIAAQQGDASIIDQPKLLYSASTLERPIKSQSGGFVEAVAAEKIGRIAMKLGAGREYKGQEINSAVGLRLYVQVGDKVRKGQTIAVSYTKSEQDALWAEDEIRKAILLTENQSNVSPLVLGIVDEFGFHEKKDG